MARAPIVALDFLGVGTIPACSKNNEIAVDEDHTTPVKPQRSSFASRSFWSAPVDMLGAPTEISVTCQRYHNQQNLAVTDNQQPISPQNKFAASIAGAKTDETGGEKNLGKPLVYCEKTPPIKPLEELTDEDIMQLTREDCRRYLKEKGMRRPSWNKSQAIQQVLSLKGLIDPKGHEEKRCKRLASDMEIPQIQQSLPPILQQAVPINMHEAHQRLPASFPPVFNSYNVQARSIIPETYANSSWQADRHGSIDVQYARQSNQMCQSFELGMGTEGVASMIHPTAGQSSTMPSFIKFPSISACPPDIMLPVPCQQQQMKGFQEMLPGHALTSDYYLSNVHGKQPTAQLTIFYSGMVNVYDDVPADKAHAIMLLAGSSNSGPFLSWNSNPCTVTSAAGTSITTAISPPANVSVSVPACYSGNNISAFLMPATTPMLSSGSRQFAATTLEPPPPRKACLQRFLEKRKDRFRTKLPYTSSRKLVSDVPPQLDPEFPMRSCERSNSSPLHQQLPLTSGWEPSQSSGSETSSPTRPPQTPQQTSSEEEGSFIEKRSFTGTKDGQQKSNTIEMERSSPLKQNSTR